MGIGLAILGGAAISGAASLLGSKKQSKAAGKAAKYAKQQYQQTRTDLMPYNQSGQMALSDLNYLMGLGPKQRGGGQMQMPTREQFTTRAAAAPDGHWTTQGNGTGSVQVWAPGPGPRFARTAGTQGSFDQAGYDRAMQQYNDYVNAPAGEDYGILTRGFNLNDFQESPAYQFNLSEGQKALSKGAAARGRYYAPATLQDLSKFSQGLASNEFGNAYNMWTNDRSNTYGRLMGMANLGENAAAQTGAFGANAANASGQARMDQGNAQAAGLVGFGNAANNAIGNYYNYSLMDQIIKARNPTYGSDGPGTWGV